MPRQSDVSCPICGILLKQPCYEDDFHEWDCFGCGLEVPDSVAIDGRDIIEALRDELLRSIINRLLPTIELPPS